MGKSSRKITALFIAIPIFFGAGRAYAAEEEKSLERRFIDTNIAISEWFDGVAEGLDLFLVGRKLTRKKNESNISIENGTNINQGKEPANLTSFNVNVRLHNVEEYWQLKFTSYDENEEKRSVEKGPLRKTTRDQNYGASLGIFQPLGNVRASFQPRVSLGDPLKVSHSLAFESVMKVDDEYEVNPKFQFFANPDKGVGTFLACNFHFILTPVFSLTFVNDGEYQERIHLFSVSNVVSLGQQLTDRTSFSYNVDFDSNNQPSYHLNAYGLSAMWHHLLYRRILDYSVGPHLIFARDLEFRGVPGATLNLRLNF